MRFLVIDREYRVSPAVVRACLLSTIGPLMALFGFAQGGGLPVLPGDIAIMVVLWPGSCVAAGLLVAWVARGWAGLVMALTGPLALGALFVCLFIVAAANGELGTTTKTVQTLGLALVGLGLVVAPIALGYSLGRGIATLLRRPA